MGKREVLFIIETIEAGQRRKYGDSYYHYIIESKQSVHVITKYCTGVLRPAVSESQHKENKKNSFDAHFESYYTELNILHEKKWDEDGLNKVEYKVVQPSTH